MGKSLWKKVYRTFLLLLLVLVTYSAVPQFVQEVHAATYGFKTVGNKTYFYDKNGKKHKGLLTYKGKTYYFNEKTGVQLKGWQYNSSKKKIRYFTKGSGVMCTGFLTDSKGRKRYFDPKTGLLTRGLSTISGDCYYFSSGEGFMQTGWLENAKGEKRYFDKSTGKMLTGWQSIGGEGKRYFNKSTGVMFTGYKKIGKYYFYLDTKTGVRLQSSFKTISKKIYYFGSNGRAVTGWQTIKGKKYYFNSGRQAVTGWQTISGKRYYFNSSGQAVTGWKTISKKKYYFDSSGAALTKWQTIDGKKYYFDSSSYVMQTGLKKIGKYYYYFSKTNGYLYQKGWGTVSGKKYYFKKSNGRALTGWQTLSGNKYYFSSKGVLYVNTTATIDGVFYTFDSKGIAKAQKYKVLSSGNVQVYDSTNKRNYTMAKEYLTHPGIANGELSDRDLLAAIIDAEANDQGVIGMEAVALCILNRTIKSDKEFPSSVRDVVYQTIPGSTYPQYSPVRNGALLKRLKGTFEEKTNAYKAADAALKVFNNYVEKGKKRTLKGFDRKDFNFMYFMTPDAYYAQPLTFSRVDCFLYRPNKSNSGHMFFVDWV